MLALCILNCKWARNTKMIPDSIKIKSHRPTPHKRNSKGRRNRGVSYLACCSLCVLLGFILATFRVSAEDVQYYDDDEEEALFRKPVSELITGFALPSAKFTPYTSTVVYSKENASSTGLVKSVYCFSHFIFDRIITSNSSIPPGYIDVAEEDTFILGSKVEENDWKDLLRHYWVAILWVVLLLCLIIIMPFLAVCYCCFCCCRRCPGGCPPCDAETDFYKRLLWGILLALLLIGLLLGIIIAFSSNYLMALGFQYTSDTMERGRNDTCNFLKDVSAHLKHLFIYNYEELDNHLENTLTYSANQIYSELMDVSGANSFYELERIFKNMEEGVTVMEEVVDLQKEMRFIGAQLRDSMRSIKRDINYACAVLCGSKECLHFLTSTKIESIDTSRCLHFDKQPDASIYLNEMKNISDNLDLMEMPDDIESKLDVVFKHIEEAMFPVVNPLLVDVDEGKYVFASELIRMRNIIDTVISSIHNHTVKSTKSFEDVESKFGASRYTINMFVCVMVTIIFIVLILALIWGCAGYSRNDIEDHWFNKGTGSWLLFLAILLIFCMFSLLVLAALFYFIMGLVTYQGVCAPLRDLGENEFFRQLDARLNMRRVLISGEPNPDKPMTPLRMSTAITACQANQSVFDLIKEHNLFDIGELLNTEIIGNHPVPNATVFPSNFSDFSLVFNEDTDALEHLINGSLSTFKSDIFVDDLCTTLTPVDLPTIAKKLRSLQSGLTGLWGYYDYSKIALKDAASNLDNCHEKFVARLLSTMEALKKKLYELDRLILNDYMPFGEGIQKIMDDILGAEKFISEKSEEFVSELRKNLSVYAESEVANYVEMVVRTCHQEVGKCAPIAYIYYRGVDFICQRLVDPLNGFWVGLTLCALFLLPILFVAHRLLCLYNKVYPQTVATAAAGGCPVCSGRSYVLPLRTTIYSRAISFDERNEVTVTCSHGSDKVNEDPSTEAAAQPAATAADAKANSEPDPELAYSSSKHKLE